MTSFNHQKTIWHQRSTKANEAIQCRRGKEELLHEQRPELSIKLLQFEERTQLRSAAFSRVTKPSGKLFYSSCMTLL